MYNAFAKQRSRYRCGGGFQNTRLQIQLSEQLANSEKETNSFAKKIIIIKKRKDTYQRCCLFF